MRKIEKDLSVIPDTLYSKATKEGKKTERKRRILLSSRSKYKNTYDECYKWHDIQDMLAALYKNKCVYCEKEITKVNAENLSGKEEISHTVEHYRPKSKYPWLAFSWDNLLWCCKKCTDIKDNKFEIVNPKVSYSKSFNKRIHKSTTLYNRLEQPKMIHPELENIMNKLVFDTTGNINSEDDRVKYTITTCELNRQYLKGERKKIFDKLVQDIEDATAQSNDELKREIIKNFKNDSENMDNEFIAFRRWVITFLIC